jgi:hypothetical protein
MDDRSGGLAGADLGHQAGIELDVAFDQQIGRYVIFQLAEVAVPRALFDAILRRIDRLRGPPVVA